MSDLKSTFERLGFQEYLNPLLEHGFDTWDDLAGINEEDMAAIGIKLGHRRRLQQETARQLGHFVKEQLFGLEDGVPQMGGQHNHKIDSITHLDRPKRRYRRRPPRDSKAPTRPDTSYVAYTRLLRQEPEVAKLSFVEIAKVVGERWARLSSDEKEIWNQNAAAQRSVYKSELAQHHQSETYQAHHDDFRSKKPRNDQWEPEVDYNNALTKEFCANHVSGRLSNTGNMEDESSTNSVERTHCIGSESARSSSIASALTPHVINDTETWWSPNSRCSSSPATSICESNKLDVNGSAFDTITTIILQDRFSKAASLPLPPNPDKILPHIFQRSAVSRSFHTQTINPFNFQTREMTLPIIDSFLQNVNTVYYLVDPDELRKNLGSVLDTSQETHNLIMSIVCLCLA